MGPALTLTLINYNFRTLTLTPLGRVGKVGLAVPS